LEEIDDLVRIQHAQTLLGSKEDKPFQEMQDKEGVSFN